MYGAAEIGTVTSINIKKEKNFLNSVGKIYDSKIKIKILSNKNSFLPPGRIGEIICKTPGIFKNYLTSEEKNINKKIFFKSYFKTGDLGFLDKNGKYLYFVGRKKNIIRRNGITLYAEDIEKELTTSGKIKEVAVCAVEKNNQTEIFLFAKKSPSLDYNYIRNKCLKNLSTFQIPNKIIMLNDFPRTNLGKIDKIKLLKLFF